MTKTEARSLAERMAGLPPAARTACLAGLSEPDLAALAHDWQFWGRPAQLPPPGDWFCWLILAGRGFGKTRAGVEWVRGLVEGDSPLSAPPGAPRRIALVAQTAADARDVMVEGESGFLACARPEFRPVYEPSRRRLRWPNGVMAMLYSAEEPDQLRGPQHHLAWGDELAKWTHAEAAWDNLLMGLRLGAHPRVTITTTPRPIALLKTLLAQPDIVVTRGTTLDNRSNLPPAFLGQILRQYQNTRLGRQELYAELLDDLPGALWSRSGLEAARIAAAPALRRVVVAVDPPVTSGARADECGIVVAALGCDGMGYVLADHSVGGATPAAWAARAVAAFHRHGADRLIAEVNNGGDLVEQVVRQVDAGIAFRAVRASRGKVARAEPVAALYEQGRVRHLPGLAMLEDQMCAFVAGGGAPLAGGSPDRVDALVWAITELMLGPSEAKPTIRRLG